MRSSLLVITGAAAIVLGFSTVSGFAQDVRETNQKPPAVDAARPSDGKPNLLAQLGLSKEQLQQIRALNIEKKPVIEVAQKRLRMASRAVDDAIYADEANETVIDARIQELQAAQSEIIRLRSSNELAVRRVLTPEQLVRFREMRQQFDEMRQQNQTRRKERRSRVTNGTSPASNMFKQRVRPI